MQCTETWFLADKVVLTEYYGDGFKQSALSANPTIEEIPRRDTMNGLGLDQLVLYVVQLHEARMRHGILKVK